MARIFFMVVEKTLYQTIYSILQFPRWCKHLTVKLPQIKLQNQTINWLSCIFSCHTLMPQTVFFIHFFKLKIFINREGLVFFL